MTRKKKMWMTNPRFCTWGKKEIFNKLIVSVALSIKKIHVISNFFIIFRFLRQRYALVATYLIRQLIRYLASAKN